MLEKITSISKISNSSFLHSYNLDNNYFCITKYNNIINIYNVDKLRLLFSFTVNGEYLTISNKYIITSDGNKLFFYFRGELIKEYSNECLRNIISNSNISNIKDNINPNNDNYIINIINLQSIDDLLLLTVNNNKSYIFKIYINNDRINIKLRNIIEYKYYYILDSKRIVVYDSNIKIINIDNNKIIEEKLINIDNNELIDENHPIIFSHSNNILLLRIHDSLIFINLIDERIKKIRLKDIDKNINNIIDIKFRIDANEILILNKEIINKLYVFSLNDFRIVNIFENVDACSYVMSYILFVRHNGIYMYDENLVKKREGVDGRIVDFISYNNKLLVLSDKNVYYVNIYKDEANYVFSRCREMIRNVKDNIDKNLEYYNNSKKGTRTSFITHNLIFHNNGLYLLSNMRISLYFEFHSTIYSISMSICKNFIIFSTKSRVSVLNYQSRLLVLEIYEKDIMCVSMCLFSNRIILVSDREWIEYDSKGNFLERCDLSIISDNKNKDRLVFIPLGINKHPNKESLCTNKKDSRTMLQTNNFEENSTFIEQEKYVAIGSSIISNHIFINLGRKILMFDLFNKELIREYKLEPKFEDAFIRDFKVFNDILGVLVEKISEKEEDKNSFMQLFFFNVVTNKLLDFTDADGFEFTGDKIIILKNNSLELYYLSENGVLTELLFDDDKANDKNSLENISFDEIEKECLELMGFLEFEDKMAE